MTKYQRWTKQDDEILIANYKEMTAPQLRETYFPSRSLNSIWQHAKSIGLAMPNELSIGRAENARYGLPWTEEEDDILREHYGKMTVSQIRAEYLPDRPADGLIHRASVLGISNPVQVRKYTRPRRNGKANRRPWTKEEIETLRTNIDMTVSELQRKFFPTRTAKQIQARVHQEGIAVRTKKYWTEEEDEIIRGHPNTSPKEIQEKYLPDRTVNAISTRAYNLGVTMAATRRPNSFKPTRKHWTEEEIGIVMEHGNELTSSAIRKKYLPHRSAQGICNKIIRMRESGVIPPKQRETAQEAK